MGKPILVSARFAVSWHVFKINQLFSISSDNCLNVFSKSKAIHGIILQGKSFTIPFCKPCTVSYLYKICRLLIFALFTECPMALKLSVFKTVVDRWTFYDQFPRNTTKLSPHNACIAFLLSFNQWITSSYTVPLRSSETSEECHTTRYLLLFFCRIARFWLLNKYDHRFMFW